MVFTSKGQSSYILEISASETLLKTIKYKGEHSSKKNIIKEVASIQMQLFEQAYLAHQLDTAWKEQTLNLTISEGRVYKWKKIHIDSASLETNYDILKDLSFFSEKELFSYSKLHQHYKEIITQFENSGYPFAQISLEDFKIDSNLLVEANLKLDRGHKITIDSVIIHGNAKISRRFIGNYLNIHRGDAYNEEWIAQSDKRLKALSFIKVSRNFKILFVDKYAQLHIYIDQRPVNLFNGLVAFSSNAENPNKLDMSGDFQLKLMNSFEHASEIEIVWNKPPGNSQKLFLYGSYPYAFNTPFGLSYSLKLDRKDSSYLNTEQKPSLRLYFSAQKSIGFHLNIFQSQLLFAESFNPDQLDLKRSNLGLNVLWSSLDHPFYPRKGYKIMSEVAMGRKTITQNTAYDPTVYDSLQLQSFNTKVQFQVGYYFSFGKRNTVFTQIKSEAYFNEQIQNNELYEIGGFDLLRGFGEDYFRSPSYAVSTLAYQFHLDESSYLSIFWDQGFLSKKNAPHSEWISPSGYGAGINMGSKAGIFSLNFAIGKEQGQIIQFRNTKVHFGYFARF